MDLRHSFRTARQYSVNMQSSDAKGCCMCVAMAGAICAVISMVLLIIAIIALGIAKLVIGGIYFHDCELQPLLPIFLIVDASIGILLGCKCQCGGEKSEEGEATLSTKIVRAIVGLFQFAWLICGTIWVVGVRDVIYSPGHCESTTTTAPPTTSTSSIILSTLVDTTTAASKCLTCNEVLTDFTFAIVIIQWILTGIVLLTLCCQVAGLCAKKE